MDAVNRYRNYRSKDRDRHKHRHRHRDRDRLAEKGRERQSQLGRRNRQERLGTNRTQHSDMTPPLSPSTTEDMRLGGSS
jgi:hypothetical protein